MMRVSPARALEICRRDAGIDPNREPHSSNPKAQQQIMAKQFAVNLVPQGTLVERIRAGGSDLERADPNRNRDNRRGGQAAYAIQWKDLPAQTAMRADFALIHRLSPITSAT